MRVFPKKGAYLEYLTWPQAEAALKEAQVILLPVGARLKEHGLHLPLNNDFVMAEYLARRIVDEVDVLAMPTMPYGYYPAFLEYPGSVSIGLETFRDAVRDLSRTICAHGPKKIYVLNTGISTNRALEQARQLLAAEGITLEFTIFKSAISSIEEAIRQEPVGTHADEIETSVMMYIAPEIVQQQLAVRDVHEDRGGASILSRDPAGGQGVYSPTGAWGDPTLASAEKGRQIVEAMVAFVASRIRALASPGFVPEPPRAQFL